MYLSLIVAAGLFAFIQSFQLLSPILLSLVLILLISLAVNPVISRVRAWTGGRRAATGLVTAALVLGLALTGWAFFGPMTTSLTRLSNQFPVYWERLQRPLIKLEQQADLFEKQLQSDVTTEIAKSAKDSGKPEPARQSMEPAQARAANATGSLRSGLGHMFQGLLGSVTTVAFNAAQILVVLVTVFFGVTFTLMNPRPIFGSIFALIPEHHHQQALTIVQRIGIFLPAWAFSTLLAMVMVGVLVFLLMWPFFGFVDALVLGLIAGVFEAIPYVGPILSAAPALLFALGNGGLTPLWILLAYLAVQTLENNVISPWIMARSMKLHSVAVLFSMLLSVAAFGVLGVLVAAPLVAILDILHDELYRKRFLPTVTDADLARLARKALHEKVSVDK